MQENWRERLHEQYLALINHSPQDRAYIDKASIDQASIETTLSQSLPSSVNPSQLLEEWRKFVSTIFILERQGELSSLLALSLNKLRELISANRWPECQILGVYEALARHLTGIDSASFVLTQLESGACPYDAAGIFEWGEVPSPALQAEMGVILFVYASLKNDKALLECALKIASWQRNTLDSRFKPFLGLFTFEGGASNVDLLINNFFLFDTAAKITKSEDHRATALKLKEQIDQQKIVSLCHLLWFNRHFSSNSLDSIPSFTLPSKIEDKQLSLIGHRGDQISVAASLCGGGSGYGCFHGPECSILSFGPQYLPLGECTGYGIKGGRYRAEEGLQHSIFKENGFILEGVSHMVSDQEDRFSVSDRSLKLLLDNLIEYKFGEGKAGELKVEVTIHEFEEKSPDERLPLAFSFFAKSLNCSIDNRHFVKPRSLNRYSGVSLPVSFLGKESLVSVHSDQKFEEMNVVPLGGGDSFWGADYLLSFILPFDQKQFSWTIKG